MKHETFSRTYLETSNYFVPIHEETKLALMYTLLYCDFYIALDVSRASNIDDLIGITGGFVNR